MAISREQLKRQAEQDGIEFFFAMFVDMHGKPCAKLIPAASFDLMMDGGAGFAGFAAGPMGQTPMDPDLIAVPDPNSYTPVPWLPGIAVLQCDIAVEGELWEYSPRVILRNKLKDVEARGLTYNVGFEAEYFLVRRTENGGIDVADPLDTADAPCYDVKALTRMLPHLTAVSKYCNQLGYTNYANDHEDANGQFEQNFKYADALTSCDRLIFFRYMVHALAQKDGLLATFMPKPFHRLTGNGLHVHSSLWRGEEALFDDPNDPRGLGLSSMAYSFAAGILTHARAATAITCPTVNSYKRIGVGAPTSGATWAPSYASYGGNNRTQMLRIPEGGRIEHRCVDGSANPYLALVAILASGLDGVDRELDPGEPNTENLHKISPESAKERGIVSMPPTLLHATEALEGDDVLRAAFGKGRKGEDYLDYYISTKRDEFGDWHSRVSDWEVDKYLTLF
jgi:glutamine synthetase